MELCVTTKENATFNEAMEAVKNGKGARRTSWDEGWVLSAYYDEITIATEMKLSINGKDTDEYVTLSFDYLSNDDFNANDWEIGLI